MKSPLRSLAIFSAVLLGLTLFVALAALTTPVQTMLANSSLAERPELEASLGSFSAGFQEIDIADLHLRHRDVVLRMPALHAELPVFPALRRRDLRIRRLVAKGWSLDFTNQPEATRRLARARPTDALPEAAVAQAVLDLFDALLRRQSLPCDLSLAALELEGEVVLPTRSDMEPLRLHVTLAGHGPMGGSPGTLEFTARGQLEDARAPVEAVNTRGRCQVFLETPRTWRLDQIGLQATVDCRNLGPDRRLTAQLDAATTPAGPFVACTLERGSRRVAALQLQPDTAAPGATGTWMLALGTADLAPFFLRGQLPEFTAAGSGRLQADAAFTRLHAEGALEVMLGRVTGSPVRWLDLDNLRIATRFALVREIHSLQIEHAEATVTGTGLQLSAKTVQPTTLALAAAGPTLAAPDPAGAWLEVSAISFPLNRLANLPSGWTIASGQASGRLGVRASPEGFELISAEPLAFRGVALQRAGQPFLPAIDATLTLIAQHNTAGWKLGFAPLDLTCEGQSLGTFTFEAAPVPANRSLALRGSWSADVAALAALLRPKPAAPVGVRLLRGDFTGTIGTTTAFDGHASLSGAEPGLAAETTVHLECYPGGILTFRAPLQLATGTERSELFIEGTLRPQPTGRPECYLQLGGKSAQWDHLVLAAASIPWLDDLRQLAAAPEPAAGAARPAWGGNSGRLRVSFDHLQVRATPLKDVTGTFSFDQDKIELTDGQARLPSDKPVRLQGHIGFDRAAALPYQLAAVLTTDTVNAEKLLPKPGPDEAAIIEGLFSFSDTLSASAGSFGDLPGQLRGQIALTGGAGIVRLLKTSIGDAYTEKPRPVTDALVNSATGFTALFGVKSSSINSGRKPVAKGTAAVFNLSYDLAEIGYQKASVTAVHAAGGPIRLTAVAFTGTDIRLTGSGEMEVGEGLPFVKWPLRLSLRLAGRGRTGELLAAAGLGAATADAEGFRNLLSPIELGGTLAAIDSTRWHDLLAATVQRPK